MFAENALGLRLPWNMIKTSMNTLNFIFWSVDILVKCTGFASTNASKKFSQIKRILHCESPGFQLSIANWVFSYSETPIQVRVGAFVWIFTPIHYIGARSCRSPSIGERFKRTAVVTWSQRAKVHLYLWPRSRTGSRRTVQAMCPFHSKAVHAWKTLQTLIIQPKRQGQRRWVVKNPLTASAIAV